MLMTATLVVAHQCLAIVLRHLDVPHLIQTAVLMMFSLSPMSRWNAWASYDNERNLHQLNRVCVSINSLTEHRVCVCMCEYHCCKTQNDWPRNKTKNNWPRNTKHPKLPEHFVMTKYILMSLRVITRAIFIYPNYYRYLSINTLHSKHRVSIYIINSYYRSIVIEACVLHPLQLLNVFLVEWYIR